DVIDVTGRVVVGVAAVDGVPLVDARGHARGETGRRGVRAVAVDRDRLRVPPRGNARAYQREGDRAGRVIAEVQERRVFQRHALPEHVRAGGRGERGAGRADHGLLEDAAVVAGGVVLAVANVVGRPGVGARHRARGRQRGAGGVDAVAADRVGLGVREAVRAAQREDDVAGRVIAALQVRRVA